MPKMLHFSITFGQCGAEDHPAFSSAYLVAGTYNPEMWKTGESDARYQMDFPIHVEGRWAGRETQKLWVEDKIKHLKSFGGARAAEIIDHRYEDQK